MTNVQIRAGGMPVPSDVLVSTDGDTILGDGSARNPLRAGSGTTVIVTDGETLQGDGTADSPLSAIGAVELVSTAISTVIDPAVPITFLSRPLSAPAGATLADPEEGVPAGFAKTICCNPTNNGSPGSVGYVITANLPGTLAQVEILNGGGGVTLIWGGDGGVWHPASGIAAEVVE